MQGSVIVGMTFHNYGSQRLNFRTSTCTWKWLSHVWWYVGHLVYQSVHLSLHALSPEISLVHMDVFIKDQMVKISQPRTILISFITVNRMSVSWNRVDDVKMYHNAILSSFELRCGRNIYVFCKYSYVYSNLLIVGTRHVYQWLGWLYWGFSSL